MLFSFLLCTALQTTRVSCITSKMKLFVNFLSISFKATRKPRSHTTVCSCAFSVEMLSFVDVSIAQRQFSQLLTL